MNSFIVLAAVVAVVVGEAPPHVGLGGYSDGGSSNGGGYSRGGGGGGSGINEYVDEALLSRVSDIIARGGDGSASRQGTEGLNLDSAILTRVSGSLGDGGSSGGPSTAYGVPTRSSQAQLGNPEPAERIAEWSSSSGSGNQQGGYDSQSQGPSPSYGAPTRGGASGGQISLGRPEVAQRVADFAVSGGSNGGPSRNGGYN